MNPTYPTVQPPAPRPIWLIVACAVIGLAVGIGIGALLFGGSDDSSKSSTPAAASQAQAPAGSSTKPISLPASLGGFRDAVDVTRDKAPKPEVAKRFADNQAKTKASTETAYSKAFGGAAVAYRGYSDDGLLKTPYVIAVRAPAPGLTNGRIEDPAYLGLAAPMQEVKAVGDTSCLIQRPATAAGQQPDQSNQLATTCERSQSGVTVYAFGGSGFKGDAGLTALAGFTDAAWTAASSG